MAGGIQPDVSKKIQITKGTKRMEGILHGKRYSAKNNLQGNSSPSTLDIKAQFA
jgi:hypothetical protein